MYCYYWGVRVLAELAWNYMYLLGDDRRVVLWCCAFAVLIW
jgi:hypothetical protein